MARVAKPSAATCDLSRSGSYRTLGMEMDRHLDGVKRLQRDAILRARDTYDYTFTEWIYGNTALFPEDEPAMHPTIPLDSVEVADEQVKEPRELVTVE